MYVVCGIWKVIPETIEFFVIFYPFLVSEMIGEKSFINNWLPKYMIGFLHQELHCLVEFIMHQILK